ncbi:MAG: transmembrane sensor [Halieaceae bacterium]|jgi:transmembrane sensor
MNLHHINAPHDGLYDQASEWISRLASDCVSETDCEAFALWLATSPAHRAAMDNTLDLWDDLAVVKTWDLDPTGPELQTGVSRRRSAIGAGLAVAASVLAFTLLPLQPGVGTGVDHYRTAIGQQLTVNLDDGSRVMLNTDSQVTVDYEKGQRRLKLVNGEAFFKVAHDEKRPFVVHTGTAEVTALGTAFNIFRSGGVSEITVTDGVVQVREVSNSTTHAPTTRVVHTDMRVASSAGGLDQPSPADPGRVTAWQQGLLPADGMNLAELVSELQRYHSQRLLIGSYALSQRTMSGIFDLSEPRNIIKALEHSLDIRVEQLDNGSLLLIETPR